MNSIIPAYRFFIRVMNENEKFTIRAKDISGLKMKVDLTRLNDAGAINNNLYLPDGITYDQLTISRALMNGESDALMIEIENILQDLQVRRLNLGIHLLSSDGRYIQNWSVLGANIVEWELSGFDTKANGVLLEKLTFKYSTLRRT